MNEHERADGDMNRTDLLVQRFVDHELSGDERVRFLARLGHDAHLRQQLLDLERLVADAGRLRLAEPPEGFVAGVMIRAASEEPVPRPRWQRWVDGLLAPRTLQWNAAAAVACAAIVAIAGVFVSRQLRPAAQISHATGGVAAPATSTVLVRLVVVQPTARTVHVAGDFNGWNPSQTPLEGTPGGAWAVTIPLSPGRYEYMFVVDNALWVGDPFAAEQTDDGFGSRNAVLDVRSAASAAGMASDRRETS